MQNMSYSDKLPWPWMMRGSRWHRSLAAGQVPTARGGETDADVQTATAVQIYDIIAYMSIKSQI